MNPYAHAKDLYGEAGVDTDAALAALSDLKISLHCWQGDDLQGFEGEASMTGSGLQVTGSYPGRARTIGELRSDLEMAFSLIPGKHRLNLHASYADLNGDKVDRDAYEPRHFQS